MQGGAEDRAAGGHGFRSSVRAAQRVSSVAGRLHSCRLRPGLKRWATFTWARSALSSSESMDKEDSLCGSRHLGFSAREPAEMSQSEEVDFSSCSYWFHTSKKAKEKKKKMHTEEYTCTWVYKLLKITARSLFKECVFRFFHVSSWVS